MFSSTSARSRHRLRSVDVLRPMCRAIVGHLAGVPEVPQSDFSSHVPAVERRQRVPDATSGEEHIGDHRDGMPAQPKVCEPWVAGMGERYLKHGVRWDGENLRPFPGRLDDQRQQVKAATGPGPAESVSQFRDAGVAWVTGYSAVTPRVGGVPDKL